jgi:hypothetical protein
MEESSRARERNEKILFDVDELLKNLKLHGEELNEVVMGKDEITPLTEDEMNHDGNDFDEEKFQYPLLEKHDYVYI